MNTLHSKHLTHLPPVLKYTDIKSENEKKEHFHPICNVNLIFSLKLYTNSGRR